MEEEKRRLVGVGKKEEKIEEEEKIEAEIKKKKEKEERWKQTAGERGEKKVGR